MAYITRTNIAPILQEYRHRNGLSAQELAEQIGVSRAALYRYQKGGVIKIDTVRKIAEVIGVSPGVLLGMASDYVKYPEDYQDEMLKREENASRLILVAPGVCDIVGMEHTESTLLACLNHGLPNDDAERAWHIVERITQRRANRERQKPAMVAIHSIDSVLTMARDGIAPSLDLPTALRQRAREAGREEAELVAQTLERTPIGLQSCLLRRGQARQAFQIIHAPEQTTVVINPLRADDDINLDVNLATITNSQAAIDAYGTIAETLWTTAIKGKEAAAVLREALDAL